MSTEKSHYRKVFKSDHLGVADLEEYLEQGKRLVFNIKEVKQHFGISVAGRKGNHNIAYFVENIKPLVLNATNSKIVKSFNNGNPFVDDWYNTVIELYIDETVQMKGEVVGGVRIRPIQPKTEKVKPEFTESNFEAAKSKGATVERIKQSYTLSSEVEQKYVDYVAKN